MCASVIAYGDEREARGRAEAAKEYQEEIARLKAELARYTAAAQQKQ